jgi:hypothetical protein
LLDNQNVAGPLYVHGLDCLAYGGMARTGDRGAKGWQISDWVLQPCGSETHLVVRLLCSDLFFFISDVEDIVLHRPSLQRKGLETLAGQNNI